MNPSLRDAVASQGYALVPVRLPDAIKELVQKRHWEELDQRIRLQTLPGGVIFDELLKYGDFEQIEFIISIRSSNAEPDEDGIWHDDGSRLLAFSLSLTLDAGLIEGGKLEFRRRGVPDSPVAALPTQPYGTLVVFATGHFGFEHRICHVARGERIVIAGWCT